MPRMISADDHQTERDRDGIAKHKNTMAASSGIEHGQNLDAIQLLVDRRQLVPAVP